MPSISIVTVCRNAASAITSTVSSVISQSKCPHQYIIVDGASTDDTVARVLGLDFPPLQVISETDGGIYDAMNKAIGLCTSDYIYFLNAGDSFVDQNVLRDICRFADIHGQPSILFGNVIYTWTTRQARRRFSHINGLTLPVADLCHQAVFVSRAAFSRVGQFDLNYRYSADFDWLLRAFRDGETKKYFDRDIASYEAYGTSIQFADLVEIEKSNIVSNHYSKYRLAATRLLFKVARKIYGVGQPRNL